MQLRLTRMLGALELVVAAILVGLGFYLPARDEVQRGFAHVDRVNAAATQQIDVLRTQVDELRRPELVALLSRLEEHAERVPATLRTRQVDFDTVVALRNALGDVSGGLDELATTFDPQIVERLGDSLGEGAAYLDQHLIPTAGSVADELEATAAALEREAELLGKISKAPAFDLDAAREVHASLGRFKTGLDRSRRMLDPKRLAEIRTGAQGMHQAVSVAADQVANLSDYSYPVVKFKGYIPEVKQEAFWKSGEKIAKGLEQAADGIDAMGKQLDTVTAEMPALHASLEESALAIERTHAALGRTIDQAEQFEPLLEKFPEELAAVSKSLPKLIKDVSKTLRETGRLKRLAASLHDARRGLGDTVGRWNRIQSSLTSTSRVLATFRDQLDVALENRDQYEAMVKDSVELSESFARALPVVNKQLNQRLDEEQRVLANLRASLDQIDRAVPQYERSTMTVVTLGRALSWLVAAIAALHGLNLLWQPRITA